MAELSLCPGSDASVSEPQSDRKRSPRVDPRYPWEQTSKDFLYMLCDRPAPASYVHDLRMHDFLRHTPAETSKSIWFIEAWFVMHVMLNYSIPTVGQYMLIIMLSMIVEAR